MPSLLEALDKSSVLKNCLLGGVQTLEKELGLKGLQFMADETAKRTIAQLGANSQANVQEITPKQYPFAYLTLSDSQADPEYQATKAVLRHGINVPGQYQRSLSMKAWLFRAKISYTLKYITNDIWDALKINELSLVLAAAHTIGFDVIYGDKDLVLGNEIEVPQSLSIPLADTSSAEDPSGIIVEIPLIQSCWVGFFYNVAAVNSNNPKLTTNVVITKGLQNVEELAREANARNGIQG